MRKRIFCNGQSDISRTTQDRELFLGADFKAHIYKSFDKLCITRLTIFGLTAVETFNFKHMQYYHLTVIGKYK